MPITGVMLGRGVKIPYPELVNIYGCEIGEGCFIGPFVEIQRDVKIGINCRIESHSFICSKARIGKRVFIGHGVIFINDKHPVNRNARAWKEIVLEDGVIVGSNATILPCKIGKNALIGAGAVVTKDVPPNKIAAGNPARIIGKHK